MEGLILNFDLSKISFFTVIVSFIVWIITKEGDNLYKSRREKLITFCKNKIWNHSFSKKEIQDIINELNRYFENDVKFFAILEDIEPIIDIVDDYAHDEWINKASIEKEKENIAKEEKNNEPHLLLKDYTDLDSKNIILKAEKTDFATIRLLRNKNEKPKIISAGAVLIDPINQELIVHLRSKNSDTYPEHYHILGGSFLPKSTKYSGTYDPKLSNTVLREISEETESKVKIIDINQPKFRTFASELSTGFIQYEYLGLVVEVQLGLKGNWEGDISPIKFSQLEEKLKTMKWVPSGKAHILAWLALGARGSKYFSHKKARKIYKNIIKIT